MALRTKDAILTVWRRETRWKAYGFIASRASGTASNCELAAMLDMDPRGLRNIIQKDDSFLIEIRYNPLKGNRGEPWYSINPAKKQGVEEPPRLLRIVNSDRAKCMIETKVV